MKHLILRFFFNLLYNQQIRPTGFSWSVGGFQVFDNLVQQKAGGGHGQHGEHIRHGGYGIQGGLVGYGAYFGITCFTRDIHVQHTRVSHANKN